MSKCLFCAAVLLAIFTSQTPARTFGSAIADSAIVQVAEGHWIYIGTREDELTGDVFYGWRWSTSDLVVWTRLNVEPPHLVMNARSSG